MCVCVCERKKRGVNSNYCILCLGFRCRSEELSIPGDFVCDRISDCFGGEDEVNCAGRLESNCKPYLSLHPDLCLLTSGGLGMRLVDVTYLTVPYKFKYLP